MCDMDFSDNFDMDYDTECDIDSGIDEGYEFDGEMEFSEEIEAEDSGFESLESYEYMDEIFEETESCTLAELDDIEPELTLPAEELESLIEESGDDVEMLSSLRDLLSSGRVAIDTEEFLDDTEDVKILTKHY